MKKSIDKKSIDKKSIYLQCLPLSLKDSTNYNHISFSRIICGPAVNYCIYDKKRKTIVSIGTSRPCGINHIKASFHAEELAIKDLKKLNKKMNRYIIYIYRYSKIGLLKPVYCCESCSKLIKKYNLQDRIYTFNESLIIVSAMGHSYKSLAYKIKYDL